ncbi:MAG: class I SAM-dependent methyltransferase [Candidatus Thorarchaeota archaeon]
MNNKEIIKQLKDSYGKNVRLKHLLQATRNKKFHKVIELGCREGWLLHNIQAQEKIGYDLKPRRIFEDIHYIKTNIESLASNNADLVICSEVIEHIENDEFVVGIIRNQLKNKGLLFLTTINKNIKVDKSEQDRRYGHVHRYGEELRTLLENSGFKTIDFYGIRSPHYYKYKGNIKNYSIIKDRQESIKEASGWVYIGKK